MLQKDQRPPGNTIILKDLTLGVEERQLAAVLSGRSVEEFILRRNVSGTGQGSAPDTSQAAASSVKILINVSTETFRICKYVH